MHSNPFPNITLDLQHGSYNTPARDYRPIGDAREIETVDRNPYKYKYNSKEWQDELELNMYAMDMRMYDPAFARWVVQDPVVHHSMSPYNAFDNNPVFWADPTGMDSWYYDWKRKDGTYVSRDTGETTNDSSRAISETADQIGETNYIEFFPKNESGAIVSLIFTEAALSLGNEMFKTRLDDFNRKSSGSFKSQDPNNKGYLSQLAFLNEVDVSSYKKSLGDALFNVYQYTERAVYSFDFQAHLEFRSGIKDNPTITGWNINSEINVWEPSEGRGRSNMQIKLNRNSDEIGYILIGKGFSVGLTDRKIGKAKTANNKARHDMLMKFIHGVARIEENRLWKECF